MYIFSDQYYQKNNIFHHNKQPNITDFNDKKYSFIPIFDYAAHIKSLDPSECMNSFIFFVLSIIYCLLIYKPNFFQEKLSF